LSCVYYWVSYYSVIKGRKHLGMFLVSIVTCRASNYIIESSLARSYNDARSFFQ
jgi:hypothetical protein